MEMHTTHQLQQDFMHQLMEQQEEDMTRETQQPDSMSESNKSTSSATSSSARSSISSGSSERGSSTHESNEQQENQTLLKLRDDPIGNADEDDGIDRPYFTKEQLLEFKASPMYQRLYGRKNPLYQTTNSQYGLKKPSEVSKIRDWHGVNGQFTKQFVGGMYRRQGLNTSTTKHPVLPDPNFGTTQLFSDTL